MCVSIITCIGTSEWLKADDDVHAFSQGRKHTQRIADAFVRVTNIVAPFTFTASPHPNHVQPHTQEKLNGNSKKCQRTNWSKMCLITLLLFLNLFLWSFWQYFWQPFDSIFSGIVPSREMYCVWENRVGTFLYYICIVFTHSAQKCEEPEGNVGLNFRLNSNKHLAVAQQLP